MLPSYPIEEIDMTDAHFPAQARSHQNLAVVLRSEGAAIAVLCTLYFSHLSGDWWLYFLAFLLPDLFMLGYLTGNRIGALCYNIGHSYLTPLLLAAAGVWFGLSLAAELALIWGAHIGLDRAIGYGLKYNGHFKDTHLGRV